MKESTVHPSLSLTPGLGLTLGITTLMVLLIGILPTVLIEMARASSLL